MDVDAPNKVRITAFLNCFPNWLKREQNLRLYESKTCFKSLITCFCRVSQKTLSHWAEVQLTSLRKCYQITFADRMKARRGNNPCKVWKSLVLFRVGRAPRWDPCRSEGGGECSAVFGHVMAEECFTSSSLRVYSNVKMFLCLVLHSRKQT